MGTAPTSPAPGTQTRLALLDGLRGIAAITVMLYHFELLNQSYGLFSRGYLFVDLFFMLSGFVLTLSAEDRMNRGWGTPGFMRARIRRLWPVIAAGVAIGAVCYSVLVKLDDFALHVALGLLMVPAIWTSGPLFPLNGPHWSLFFELLANLAHGLVLRRLGDRALLAVAAIAGVMLALAIAGSGSNTMGMFGHDWWYGLPRVAYAYPLGIWMGRKWMARDHRQVLPWLPALTLPTAAVLLLSAVPVPDAAGDILVTLVLFPMLFWIAATARPPQTVTPALNWLGSISFPLYAVHLPILSLVGAFGRSWLFTALAIGSVLLVSQVLAARLERAHGRGRTRSSPARTAMVPEPASTPLG